MFDSGLAAVVKHPGCHDNPTLSAHRETDTARARVPLDSYPLARPRVLAIWDGAFASAALPEGGQLLIGRGMAADLRVLAASVSREHALLVDGDPPCIIDADSANGVHVDGVRISPGQAVPFDSAAFVELGGAFLLLQHVLPGPVSALAPESCARTLPPPRSDSHRATHIDVLENAVQRVRRLEPPSARLQRLADAIATTTLSVLLLGEPGVGKASLARRLHRRSPRSAAPFLAINCAAFPSASLRPFSSLLRDVSGGTVLLENVDQLALELQAELLEVTGPASAFPPGREQRRPHDVRLIASSTFNLGELLTEERFRSDLYLRLGGVRLTLPPLRERPNEILPLAHQFLVEASGRSGLPVPQLSKPAQAWLLEHAWPGNLLELRRVMERALSRCQGEPIALGHLQRARDFEPEAAERAARAISLHETLPEPERPTNPFAAREPLEE
jgi:two-component system, NtrC family, response regulator AtoC